VLLLASTAYATSALGCTIGSQVREQDLPEALESNEFAFVARLADYARVAPAMGDDYFRGSIAFDSVESIKGSPEDGARLIERTGEPAANGLPPGPACGPFVATPNGKGATFLIFASRDAESGHLRPDPRSLRLDIPGAESEKWLALVRTTHHNSSTP
jgi:hypothetical protein